MADVDPGPPPETGIVVRAEDEGFYARVQPSPKLPWPALLGGLAVFAGVGTAIAFLMAERAEIRPWIIGSCVLFGALIGGFVHFSRFFPVEIRGDDSCLSWGGDRFPWVAIGDCGFEGGTIELKDPQGTVLARVDHLEPEAARWVAQAIQASLS